MRDINTTASLGKSARRANILIRVGVGIVVVIGKPREVIGETVDARCSDHDIVLWRRRGHRRRWIICVERRRIETRITEQVYWAWGPLLHLRRALNGLCTSCGMLLQVSCRWWRETGRFGYGFYGRNGAGA